MEYVYCSVCGRERPAPHDCWNEGLKAARACVNEQRTGSVGMALSLKDALEQMEGAHNDEVSDMDNELRAVRSAYHHVLCAKYKAWDATFDEDDKR